MTHYVYLLECMDGSIYTGYTNDLSRRISEHSSGSPKSAKYVRAKGFLRLLYSEEYTTKADAMKREAEIKKWNRQKKQNLLGNKA